MRCPDDQKAHYSLYREFLLELCPALAAVDHGGMAAAITSDGFRVNSKAVAIFGEHLDVRGRLQGVLGAVLRYDATPVIVRWIRQQTAGCQPLSEYLSASAIRAIVADCALHTQEQIDTLFTVTSTIVDLTTGTSILEW
jgi:hypothetical protein